ncbi:MAG: hypothetical protein LBG89_00875 [Rickettsiales bacterium]|nr:hypothetical protein [Rickettsiales bacterium]
MSKISVFFKNIKKSSPVWLRWVLLGVAAMLLVIFVLVILPGAGGRGTKPAAVGVSIKSNPESVAMNGIAGNEIRETIEISSSMEVAIFDVKLAGFVSGLSMNNTCVSLQRISKDIPCQINLMWTPAAEVKDNMTQVIVEYGAIGAPKDAALMHEVQVSMNAEPAAVAEPEPEPIIEPEPLPDLIDDFADDLALDLDDGFAADFIDDFADVPFEEPPFAEVSGGESADVPAIGDDNECYKFASIGYNLSGQRSGWIRPQNGQYFFHPFSDAKCKSPTGVYDINSGFIFDIKDRGKKIGSDAERMADARVLRRNIDVPRLANPPAPRIVNRAVQLTAAELGARGGAPTKGAKMIQLKVADDTEIKPSSVAAGDAIVSSAKPYDRKFVLRQFKPIPATIVSDVRADQRVNELPVRAVVERNVYSDNDRTIIIPTGTLLLGYVTGQLPGPYKTIGRITINWYQMIRPDGVEFHLGNTGDVYAADSQGRVGVPGRGSTDYLEEMVIPMAAALVPAAVNLVAPISDRFVNQIDLNNNTVTQSGQMRSSELAKQEIIKSWDKVTQRLFMDMMDNMTPPFTIPAGTRITVLSRKDIAVNWPGSGLEGNTYTARPQLGAPQIGITEEDIIGQVRSTQYNPATGKIDYVPTSPFLKSFQRQSDLYEAQYQAQQRAYMNQQNTMGASANIDECGNNIYLNLRYIPGTCQIANPNSKAPSAGQQSLDEAIFSGELGVAPGTGDFGSGLVCEDGTPPDNVGCCSGEELVPDTEVGPGCCPIGDPYAECFPPMF